jgi:hypothetical protein
LEFHFPHTDVLWKSGRRRVGKRNAADEEREEVP